jgi:DNA-binding response OmpR family regulator
MSDFTLRHVARIDFPDKHIVVCEDDILCQSQIMNHFNDIFERQGKIRITLFSGTIELAHILAVRQHTACQKYCIDLILLDHDLPYGNGTDLLKWMNKENIKVPIITFSGQPINNRTMMNLGADYEFTKDEVIDGKADGIIKNILYPAQKKKEDKEYAVCN